MYTERILNVYSTAGKDAPFPPEIAFVYNVYTSALGKQIALKNRRHLESSPSLKQLLKRCFFANASRNFAVAR